MLFIIGFPHVYEHNDDINNFSTKPGVIEFNNENNTYKRHDNNFDFKFTRFIENKEMFIIDCNERLQGFTRFIEYRIINDNCNEKSLKFDLRLFNPIISNNKEKEQQEKVWSLKINFPKYCNKKIKNNIFDVTDEYIIICLGVENESNLRVILVYKIVVDEFQKSKKIVNDFDLKEYYDITPFLFRKYIFSYRKTVFLNHENGNIFLFNKINNSLIKISIKENIVDEFAFPLNISFSLKKKQKHDLCFKDDLIIIKYFMENFDTYNSNIDGNFITNFEKWISEHTNGESSDYSRVNYENNIDDLKYMSILISNLLIFRNLLYSSDFEPKPCNSLFIINNRKNIKQIYNHGLANIVCSTILNENLIAYITVLPIVRHLRINEKYSSNCYSSDRIQMKKHLLAGTVEKFIIEINLLGIDFNENNEMIFKKQKIYEHLITKSQTDNFGFVRDFNHCNLFIVMSGEYFVINNDYFRINGYEVIKYKLLTNKQED